GCQGNPALQTGQVGESVSIVSPAPRRGFPHQDDKVHPVVAWSEFSTEDDCPRFVPAFNFLLQQLPQPARQGIFNPRPATAPSESPRRAHGAVLSLLKCL